MRFSPRSSQVLNARGIPFIPYLPVHLRDLTFLEEPPDTFTESDVVLVNYEKMKSIHTAITSALGHQNTYECDTPGSMSGLKNEVNFLRSVRSSPSVHGMLWNYVANVIMYDRDEEELVQLSGRVRPYPQI